MLPLRGSAVSLKVYKAYARDAGRSAARMDGRAMGELVAPVGNAIEITGQGGWPYGASRYARQTWERG